jgi:hypothetical protein
MIEPTLHTDGDAATSRDDAFWRAHGGVGLVWSNCDASDSVMIAHALLQPNFHLLLAIAKRFGFLRLKSEWNAVKKGVEEGAFPEELEGLRRVTPIVERSIKHMEEALR